MDRAKDPIYFRFSKITVLFASFIIISASFMRQVLEFIQSYVGSGGIKVTLALIMITASSAFLKYVTKNRVHPIRTPSIFFVLILGLLLAWQVKYPAEKIHILEYGVLGWLATRDLIKVKRKGSTVILASIFCAAIGFIDEIFQAILPYRVYDVRDIVFNSLGGVWGIILYLLM